MAKYSVVAISGSPSAKSKTGLVAERTLELIRDEDTTVLHVRLGGLDAAALLQGNTSEPGIAAYLAAVAAAQGVVIATPIYKAAYSGLLKAGLDLLPQFGLAGKVVLPVGTGGSLAHVLALDYALRPVLQSMAARHVVQAHFLCEADRAVTDAGIQLLGGAEDPLLEALRNFKHSLTDGFEARSLGHPRPPRAD